MCVNVPQDGHGLHRVRVPDTDEWVLTHLTRRHLDLVRVDGQAVGGGAEGQGREGEREI